MTAAVRLAIPDVIEVTPRRFGDGRGWFMETWSERAFAEFGVATRWVQDNHSYSAAAGVIRGLHFQTAPQAQAKLIRVLAGAIFDVAVDIRRASPSYGRWVATELTAEKGNQLFIPAGFAHGFITLSDATEVAYKVSAPYSPDHERAIRWDDADLAIAWPATRGPVELSDKDRQAPAFADLPDHF